MKPITNETLAEYVATNDLDYKVITRRGRTQHMGVTTVEIYTDGSEETEQHVAILKALGLDARNMGKAGHTLKVLY